jgi:hypothetical protein
LNITDILNNVFRPQKTLKKTRIKLCNTLALPVLLYGSETIKARVARRITAAEMENMRRTEGYTWAGYKTNTNCKGVKNNTSFGKITAMKEEMDTTCK